MLRLNEQLSSISSYLEEREDDALAFLSKLVNINSYSYNKEGVDRVGKILLGRLSDLGFSVNLLRQKKYGDHVVAEREGEIPGKIILMGHMDTVFPKEESKLFKVKEKRAYGSGVADMKGGLACIIYSLMALKSIGWKNLKGIRVLLIPDEEIGSPTSHEKIRQLSQDADAVFNFEAARADGSIVSCRKGSAHLKITVKGRAAHSGLAIEKGVSAIEGLARKTIKLHNLTNLDTGVTVNVGTFNGGTNTNVVAAMAVAKVHLCFWRIEQANQALAKIKEIVDHSYLPGTSSRLDGGISFYPMEKTDAVLQLLKVVKETGRLMSIIVRDTKTKGASDAGIPASLGIPTLCGMGPVGSNYHQESEYMEVPTLIERAKLVAGSLVVLSSQLRNHKNI